MSSRGSNIVVAAFLFGGLVAFADDVLYRYEGDVLPYDAPAGWIVADPCGPPCNELLVDGYFNNYWPVAGNMVNYHHWIAQPPTPPPLTLWVEWRFRSNHLLGPVFYQCDARFTMRYGGMHELVNLYGDAAISFSGDSFIVELDSSRFHTFRMESYDGMNYYVSVDGTIFIVDSDDNENGYHYLQFGGLGGCIGDQIPDLLNEWDYIRYGTIAGGERIMAADPPPGFLNASQYPSVDRIALTFDAPSYVYIDDVSVDALNGGAEPTVSKTWRRDGDGPETLEIVLDQPLPLGRSTRLTLDDGVVQNVLDYIYPVADLNADGQTNLDDYRAFTECFTGVEGPPILGCFRADQDDDGDVDLIDFAGFQVAYNP